MDNLNRRLGGAICKKPQRVTADNGRWTMNHGRVSMIAISIGISLLVSAVVLVVGQPFTAKAQEAKRYQYKIVEVISETQNMQNMLNEFGASGWDLVAVSTGSMTETRLIFKK